MGRDEIIEIVEKVIAFRVQLLLRSPQQTWKNGQKKNLGKVAKPTPRF